MTPVVTEPEATAQPEGLLQTAGGTASGSREGQDRDPGNLAAAGGQVFALRDTLLYVVGVYTQRATTVICVR